MKKIIALTVVLTVGICNISAVKSNADFYQPEITLNEAEPAFNENDFFVYVGTYDEQPQLEYYYYSPGYKDNTNYRHKKTVSTWEICNEFNLEYGDILIADGEFETEKISSTMYVYNLLLNDDTTLTKAGNCMDLMEHKNLTFESSSYDGHPLEPHFNFFTYIFSDDDGRNYYFSYEYWLSAYPWEIDCDSTTEFAVYKDSAIIPIVQKSDTVQPSDAVQSDGALSGDANVDGYVNIADATAIIQYIANGDRYSLSEQGYNNADCYNTGDGVTGLDALAIQKFEAKSITSLPLIEKS